MYKMHTSQDLAVSVVMVLSNIQLLTKLANATKGIKVLILVYKLNL